MENGSLNGVIFDGLRYYVDGLINEKVVGLVDI